MSRLPKADEFGTIKLPCGSKIMRAKKIRKGEVYPLEEWFVLFRQKDGNAASDICLFVPGNLLVFSSPELAAAEVERASAMSCSERARTYPHMNG